MKIKTNNRTYSLSWLFTAILILSGIQLSLADGSKDLYPNGASGGRAYLRASTSESAAFPFPNLGTHYVYAEAGERIALASSAQAFDAGGWQGRDVNRNNIKLYGPNGNQITLSTGSGNDTRGLISGRSAELAGPQLPGQSGGARYTPVYHEVTVTGIYKVEYLSTSRNTTGDSRMNYVAANGNWTQANGSNYLTAWDISVAKQTGSSWSWADGRVYTTVLNMDNPSYGGTSGNDNNNFRPNSGFHGKFKVLTRDGYVYNVDNNGSQGISFTFMVNNRGFHVPGDPNTPSYQSIAAPNANAVKNRYHDPRIADSEAAVTQKIFYSLPDGNMPESAIGGPEANTETWLRIPEKELDVDEIKVEGVEGTENKLGSKGAYIKFYNESGGDYYIKISPKPGSSTIFPEREMTGPSAVGDNKILWDGKDGAGNPLPNGMADVEIELKLRGAEVHFPYIDMELNHFGIVIELLETDIQSVKSDRVYWDDSNIRTVNTNTYGSMTSPRNASHTSNTNGQPSNTNGHIWGSGSNRTVGTFGDDQGMDTWTFIEGDAITISIEVAVRIADLEIPSITPDKFEVIKDEKVTFTVVAKNGGPSDVEDAPFSFIIPDGFEPVTIDFDGNGCGIESQELEFDAGENIYNSKLDLPDGCEVTYEVILKATSDVSIGDNEFTATIMRPNDVTDPDATNPDPLIPPTDPFYECEHNGLGGECNNIKSAVIEYIIQPAIELLKSGVFVDVDNNGIANVGDEIHYSFTVTNTGNTPLTDIMITDPLVTITGGPIDLDSDESDDTTFTAVYEITQDDIDNGGVYNLATVVGKDPSDKDVSDTSKDPDPLDPGDPNYDPDCPDCTFVPLKGGSLLITNPMIRQKVKKLSN